MITVPELIEAVPVIVSLIVIESLLSVDNALAVAALASHLPGHQRKLAMRLGIAGAYVFRGIAMATAAWIVHNEWIRVIGAVYLIYLMCAHLTAGEGEKEGHEGGGSSGGGLFSTILKIELLDLSLSLDNVIAAVAMSRKLWVVCTGVFIGILALRFLAGYCLKLLERYPILSKTAFILVGWVGVVLTYELAVQHEIPAYVKFVGIGVIIALTILYSRSSLAQRLLRPVIALSELLMKVFATVVNWLVWPLRKIVDGIGFLCGRLAGSEPPPP